MTFAASMSSGRAAWAAATMAWTAAILLHVSMVGFVMQAQGRPLSLRQSVNTGLALAIGALLSPPFLLALRRLAPVRLPALARGGRYLILATAYFAAWTLLAVTLARLGAISRPSPLPGWGPMLVEAAGRLAFNSLVIFFILVVVHEAKGQRDEVRRRQLESAALEAELARVQAMDLRSRLRPSFLFATLGLAAELVDRDVPTARKVLADLGELLRVALARDADEEVPLRDEIRLAERRVAIASASRRSIRLTHEIHPRAASTPLPALLLSTLIADLLSLADERPAPLHLEILARVEAERTHLRLTVDGSPAPALPAIVDCVAASDARARLRGLYGDRASLEVLAPAAAPPRIEIVVPASPVVREATR